MSRGKKLLVVFVVAALGLWGCAQGTSGAGAGSERIKDLEGKVAALKGEVQTATTARDQARKKAADVQEQVKKLEQDLEAQQATATREREDLRQQITARTSERDAAFSQFEGFRKNIHNLLQQADSAAGSIMPAPVLSATTPAGPGNS
jgi:TolA-binding protein